MKGTQMKTTIFQAYRTAIIVAFENKYCLKFDDAISLVSENKLENENKTTMANDLEKIINNLVVCGQYIQ